MSEIIRDVIIIGGGPAGLTSGIYASRARMKALLIDNFGIQGQALTADIIENYPGFHDGFTGIQFIANLKKQSEKFGLQTVSEKVVTINYSPKIIEVQTEDNLHHSRSLIIATGSKPRELGIPGENTFTNRGVSYCAVCDAPLYKNKSVVVIGGGDTAIEEALFLSKFAEKVTIIHRREKLRAVMILQERVLLNRKITLVWNSQVTEISGANKVESVQVENVQTREKTKIDCDAVFMAVGYEPNTQLLKNIVKVNEKGYIITDDEMKTDKPGIFAAGDCRQKRLKQMVTACSDGATAAFSAEQYVDSLE